MAASFVSESCNVASHNNQLNFLQITNSKVVEFYSANPQISFNDVNVLFLEIIQNVTTSKMITKPRIEAAILRPEKKRQLDELQTFIDKIRESIQLQIQYISSKYVIAKSEYINEFYLAFSEPNSRAQLLQNNVTFLIKTRSLLFAVGKMRCLNIAEKTQTMIRQFEKILNANVESIALKPENAVTSKEFADNFESNASHMMQAILQLLAECVSSNESRVKHLSDLLKQGDDVNSAFYYKLIYDLNDILHQIPLLENNASGSSINSFEFVLSQTFPTASIFNADTLNNEFILSRTEKADIYIETYEIRDKNVGAGEVKRFITRSSEKQANGIIISQHTGITGKPNYNVEIHNNRVIVYLHKMSYSSDKLQIAVDMIDALTSKLTDFLFSSENKYAIPKEVLDDVNREYQQFIIQKETVLTIIKEQHKRLLSQMDEFRFAALDKYLATRYSSCKKQGYTCELCGIFNVGTLKGLAAHKRGCARKRVANNEITPTPEDLLLKDAVTHLKPRNSQINEATQIEEESAA
jgi:hypothetical protein